jgi:hypothetical protein
MMQIRLLAAFLIFLFGTAEALAQAVLGGAGVGIKRSRTSLVVFGRISYTSPYLGTSYRRVTIYYYPTSLAISTPGAGGQPEAPAEREETDDKIIIRPRPRQLQEEAPPPKPEPAPEKAEVPLPGVPASVFRPIGPENRARALQPQPPEAVPQPPVPPPDNPPSESARQTALAKEAFVEGAYGLAERRFRQATVAAPDEPLAYFLLAQAQFAQGKYQEAVASIQAGLRLQPDWPGARFRPRELYAIEAADFLDHLQRLTETLPRFPQDPVLLFLLAYQLWFDGQRAEARKLFERAAAVTPDRTFIEAFLR